MQMLKNELTFHLATEAAKIGFWERDLATHLMTHCAVTAGILGWDTNRTSCSVEEFEQAIDPEDLPLFCERLHAAVMSGEAFDLEFRVRLSGKGSEVRWVSTRGMGIRDHQGKAVKATGVMFDITDRKLAEQALHDTQLRYQLATEAAQIGTWEQDIAGGITYISPITAQVLGLPSDKTFLRREEWQAMILPEDLPKTEDVREHVVKEGESFNLELRYRRPDGRIIWAAVRGLLQLDKNRNPVRRVGIIQDISDAK